MALLRGLALDKKAQRIFLRKRRVVELVRAGGKPDATLLGAHYRYSRRVVSVTQTVLRLLLLAGRAQPYLLGDEAQCLVGGSPTGLLAPSMP